MLKSEINPSNMLYLKIQQLQNSTLKCLNPNYYKVYYFSESKKSLSNSNGIFAVTPCQIKIGVFGEIVGPGFNRNAWMFNVEYSFIIYTYLQSIYLQKHLLQ